MKCNFKLTMAFIIAPLLFASPLLAQDSLQDNQIENLDPVESLIVQWTDWFLSGAIAKTQDQPLAKGVIQNDARATTNHEFAKRIGPMEATVGQAFAGTQLLPIQGPQLPEGQSIVLGQQQVHQRQAVQVQPNVTLQQGTRIQQESAQTAVKLQSSLQTETLPSQPLQIPQQHAVTKSNQTTTTQWQQVPTKIEITNHTDQTEILAVTEQLPQRQEFETRTQQAISQRTAEQTPVRTQKIEIIKESKSKALVERETYSREMESVAAGSAATQTYSPETRRRRSEDSTAAIATTTPTTTTTTATSANPTYVNRAKKASSWWSFLPYVLFTLLGTLCLSFFSKKKKRRAAEEQRKTTRQHKVFTKEAMISESAALAEGSTKSQIFETQDNSVARSTVVREERLERQEQATCEFSNRQQNEKPELHPQSFRFEENENVGQKTKEGYATVQHRQLNENSNAGNLNASTASNHVDFETKKADFETSNQTSCCDDTQSSSCSSKHSSGAAKRSSEFVNLGNSSSKSKSTDDLTRISGIGSASAALLKRSGVRTFKLLAEANPEQIARLFANAGENFKLIDTSQWVPQARYAMNNDWNGLTQWLAANVDQTRTVSSYRVPEGGMDDLTQISGIGPATQKHLRHYGINTFEAIANMDIEELEGLFSSTDGRFQLLKPATWPSQAKALMNSAQDSWEAKGESILDEIREMTEMRTSTVDSKTVPQDSELSQG